MKYKVNATIVICGKKYYPGETAELTGDFTAEINANQLIPVEPRTGGKTAPVPPTTEKDNKTPVPAQKPVKAQTTPKFTAEDIRRAASEVK